MDAAAIANLRLISQQLTGSRFRSVRELAGWMGAMQAQDYEMMKWAVGLRLNKAIESLVVDAIGRGEVIRTHLLRPTWHLVSAEDIYWMLELTAPHIRSGLKSRRRELELTESELARSNDIIAEALEGGKHLTRRELLDVLERNKIDTARDNRAGHLLLEAELSGIACSGRSKGGRISYALLAERVPEKRSLSREEALFQLARRYFTSHGPATLRDFTWWSGLPVRDGRLALESLKPGIESVNVNAQEYWFVEHPGNTGSSDPPASGSFSACLLPAYDEFLISYKDRSASLPERDFHKAISNYGLFRPVILINGQVRGTWKKMPGKDGQEIEARLFSKAGNALKRSIDEAAKQYGYFTGMETRIKYLSGNP